MVRLSLLKFAIRIHDTIGTIHVVYIVKCDTFPIIQQKISITFFVDHIFK